MFKNYLKIAWRSLKKQPLFATLNTFGLAIGMVGGLLIGLYIFDEFSFDKMFADAHRIHRIDTDIKFGGAEIDAAESAAPMAATVVRDFPQVESAVRIRTRGGALVRRNGTEVNTKELHTAFADAEFFSFFGIHFLAGDINTALTEPNTLVLTKTAAEKHFGIANAIGQQLLLNNKDTFTVTGVVDDLPRNSTFRDLSIFMAMAGHEAAKEDNWGGTNFFTFIKLLPNAKISDLKMPLEGLLERYMLPWAQKYFPGMTAESFAASGNYIRYYTIPLTNIHLYSNRNQEISANSSIQNVRILSFIGFFLIILAIVNFMNLSTANSLKRAKEVGVRKTLGSNTSDLIRQFLTESGLISFISLLIALVIAAVTLPYFNTLSGKAIEIPFTSPLFWLVILGATIVLGFVSGSYPAFFMSRFMPAQTLKGGGQSQVGGGTIRNGLVVFQFTISVFLIVATLVVFQQINFIQNKDLGYTKNQVLLIDDVYTTGDKLNSFKEDIEALSQVESATVTSFLPTPSSRSNSSLFREGYMSQEHAIQIQTWGVDQDYLKTLNLELTAGRNFNKKFPTDSTAIIINESALKTMGVTAEEALGMRVTEDADLENKVFYTVIGVIKNFHYESLHEEIEALSLFLRSTSSTMAVKLNASNYTQSIASIKGLWNKAAPGQTFSYRFMNDSFNTTYEAEQRLSKIFITFTILSIFIACLGLFGLAAFNAQKRTKEIGVRKVMGATVGQISYALTVDFLKLVAISILIALPIGWFAMSNWLESFSYKIELGWWVFVLAALLGISVAIITVSYQSIKAAIVNPIKSLRSE